MERIKERKRKERCCTPACAVAMDVKLLPENNLIFELGHQKLSPAPVNPLPEHTPDAWQTPAPIFPRHIQTAIISPSITKWKSRICSSHAGKSPFSLVTTIPTAHKHLVVYTLFGRSLDAQLPKVESSMLKLQSLLKMLHQIRSMFNAIGVCLVMFQIMPMLTC